MEIFKTAKESGAVTIADMTFDTKKLGPHHFDSLYPYVDYCMPSFEEASYVTGEKKDPDAMADALLQRGAKHVLIKLEEKDVSLRTERKDFIRIPTRLPLWIRQAVGTTLWPALHTAF